MRQFTIADAVRTHLAHKWAFHVTFADNGEATLVSEVGGTFHYDAAGVLIEEPDDLGEGPDGDWA